MKQSSYWIGGNHAVEAALLNQKRKKLELVFLDKNRQIENQLLKFKEFKKITNVKNGKFFNKIFPANFKHQGIAAKVLPRDLISLKEHLKINKNESNIVMLDGITDPRNIGSIIRNCVAFNVSSIIFHGQGLNIKTPTMYLAASGAIENINFISVKNIASALKVLKENGYWVLGFDGNSESIFNKNKCTKKNILIFGDEGLGLRDLTKQSCDELVKIPINKKIESLNVSSAVVATLSLLNLG